jgi:hypothetical protein
MWWDHLPASVAFWDVETTGLGNDDRIVSFGGIGMISRDLARSRPVRLLLGERPTSRDCGNSPIFSGTSARMACDKTSLGNQRRC